MEPPWRPDSFAHIAAGLFDLVERRSRIQGVTFHIGKLTYDLPMWQVIQRARPRVGVGVESGDVVSERDPVETGEAEPGVDQPGHRLVARLGGGLGVLAAVPAGAVAGCLALVGIAALFANRWLAGLAGVTAMVAVTLAVARWGAGRMTAAVWARRMLAGAAVGLSIVLVGGAVWGLVYAPAPKVAAPDPNGVSYWDLRTGSRIAYRHAPAAVGSQAVPVVLVHGGPGSPDSDPAAVAPALSNAGFDVYRYDQLGAGLSSRLDDVHDYTVTRHVADLDAIRDVIGAQRLNLVGSSWGGTLIASYLADHPDRVARAVVSSPSPLWAPAFDDDARLTESGRRDQLTVVGDHPRFAVANVMLDAIGVRPTRALFPDRQIDGVFAEVIDGIDLRPGCSAPAGTVGDDPAAGVGFWVNEMTVRNSRDVPDPRPALSGIHVPVLVLRAECDYLSWDVTREYRDVLPDAVLVPIDGSGHAVARDSPELHAGLVREFLRDGTLIAAPHTSHLAPW